MFPLSETPYNDVIHADEMHAYKNRFPFNFPYNFREIKAAKVMSVQWDCR